MHKQKTKYLRVLFLFLLFFGIAGSVHALKITLNYLANPSVYIPQIQESLRNELMVDVTLKDIQWTTWGGLGVEIKGLKIGSENEHFEFGKIVMIFRILPLLKKQIIIDRIRVSNADIRSIQKEDGQVDAMAIIRDAIRYLNYEPQSSDGFAVGAAIRNLSIGNVHGLVVKNGDVGNGKVRELGFTLKDFQFEVSAFFNTIRLGLAGSIDEAENKSSFELREEVENMSSEEFVENFAENFPDNLSIDPLLKGKTHTFFLKTEKLPLGKILRFFNPNQEEEIIGEIVTGEISASGKDTVHYSGNIALANSKGKVSHEPRFSGFIHPGGITIESCTFAFDKIPVSIGGEIDYQQPDMVSIFLKSEAVEIQQLAKQKEITESSESAADFFRKVSKGRLTITELKTSFPKRNANGEFSILDPKGIKEELRKNLASAKGTLQNALFTTPSGKSNSLTNLDFFYNGKLLQLSKGRVEVKTNFIDIANVVYNPETETAEGNLVFTLNSLPLTEMDEKAPPERELVFPEKPAFPATFRANIKEKSCFLSATINQEKGQIDLKGGNGFVAYKDLKGHFDLDIKGEDISFLASVDNAAMNYGSTTIEGLSFEVHKKRKFFSHRVKQLAGTLKLEELTQLYSFLDYEGRNFKAKGTLLADLKENQDQLSGTLDIQNLLLDYVDQITESPGTVAVKGKTVIALKPDLSDVVQVDFDHIEMKDSFDGKIDLKGKVWKSREKLFTDLEIKGAFDAGALRVAYEDIVGEDFFLSTGFSGFYGITGKATIEGIIKGNVTDRPETIDLKLDLLDLALLDSDNGNLWNKITGNIHVKAQGTDIGRFEYFVGENRYVLENSRIALDKNGKTSYHIHGKGYIDLEKYHDDNKLFSRSLRTIDIRNMRGKGTFEFHVDEEKEKAFLKLAYDFTKADFTFWKDIHKQEGEKLKVTLKGNLLNDPAKLYFKVDECLIDYLEDKYTLLNSEFFDNQIFDIHLSATNAHLSNLLKLLDFRNSEDLAVDGTFNTLIDISNFSEAIGLKGTASLKSFSLRQGKNTFNAPQIEITCAGKNCTSAAFVLKANNEDIVFNRSEITMTGRDFNTHWLSLTLFAEVIDFDRIFGENFYRDWYRENISKRVAEPPADFEPKEYSGKCLYCDKNRYDLGLAIGGIKLNNLLFHDFKFNLSSQFGIVNLDNVSANYNDGSIVYQGRYNRFKDRPVSIQGSMNNLDLNIINAFIPDLSFFSAGKGDLGFYFSSSLNSREIYDYAKGELSFDFKTGSIDRYKWFKKINYKSGRSDADLQNLAPWKFSKIKGNGVMFGDKITLKRLYVEGEDKNIASQGDFAIKPKEINFTLAAYPLARMENIPLVGKILADIVAYYGIKGNLQEVKTNELKSADVPKPLLETFSSIISDNRKP